MLDKVRELLQPILNAINKDVTDSSAKNNLVCVPWVECGERNLFIKELDVVFSLVVVDPHQVRLVHEEYLLGVVGRPLYHLYLFAKLQVDKHLRSVNIPNLKAVASLSDTGQNIGLDRVKLETRDSCAAPLSNFLVLHVVKQSQLVLGIILELTSVECIVDYFALPGELVGQVGARLFV
jgi:hypothetical protein